jgi:hypothetical protein
VGSLIHDALKSRDADEAAMAQAAASRPGGSALLSNFSEKRRRKYLQSAAWLVVSLVACVMLARSGIVQYDSSGPGVLDPGYQKEIKTSNGKAESTSYRVTYKFDVRGKQYSGRDSLDAEPTGVDITVHFMAGDPRQNALSETRALVPNLLASGIALLIAIIAYVLLPKSFRPAAGLAPPADPTASGDSGYEFIRMKRGKYDAWGYVHLAFFVQVAWVAAWAAFGIAVATHAAEASSALLGTAVFVGIASTLWIYTDRWCCIEAFSSRFCSGMANLSLFYVPVIAFFYANYRGFKKLIGRY